MRTDSFSKTLFAALVLAAACTRRNAPVARHDAAVAPRDPVPRREPPSPPASAPTLTPGSLTDEPARAFPPGAPPGCALAPPVRTLRIPPGVDPVFATAVSRGAALLAVSIAADAVVILADPLPRFVRGAPDPGSSTLAASAMGDRFVLAWSTAGGAQTDEVPLRFAWLGPGDAGTSLEQRTLVRRTEAHATDLACDDSGCTLAWGWIDSFASDDLSLHAALTSLRPDAIDAPAPTDFAPPGDAPFNALPPSTPSLRGTLRRDGGIALVSRAGAAASLDGQVLDVARAGGRTLVLRAQAPGDDPCQPGAWETSLGEITPGGGVASWSPVARTDARPRGARIRDVAGEPLLTWLDAPQCATGFFVIRAFRRGETAAITTAQDYDIAAAGTQVSLVLRDRDQLRWVRYHCP